MQVAISDIKHTITFSFQVLVCLISDSESKNLRKQNEIDFIESHFQILHHLKIVHLSSTEVLFLSCYNNNTVHGATLCWALTRS